MSAKAIKHSFTWQRILAFSAGVLVFFILQRRTIVYAPNLDWPLDLVTRFEGKIRHAPRATPLTYPEPIDNALQSLWPLAGGLLFLLLFGPKQTHAHFRHSSTASMIYGNIPLNRNAASRGHFATGKTGSGKTQVILNPVLHSRFINESGRIRKSWYGSATAKSIEKAKSLFKQFTAEQVAKIEAVETELRQLEAAIRKTKDSAQSHSLQKYISHLETITTRSLHVSTNTYTSPNATPPPDFQHHAHA